MADEVIKLVVVDGPFSIAGRGGSLYLVAPIEGVTKVSQIVGHDFIVDGERRRAIAVERFSTSPAWAPNLGILFAPAG